MTKRKKNWLPLMAVFAFLFALGGCEDLVSGVSATIYRVQVLPSLHGSVTVNPENPAVGETVTLTVTPDDDYRLVADSLKANDGAVEVAPSEGPAYTFVMPAANVTVEAEFEIIPSYTVTITNSDNGTVTRTGTGPVKSGATVTLTVIPSSDYRLVADSLKVNDGAVDVTSVDDSGETWTFTMPEEDVTVEAEFEELPPQYTVTITSSDNGEIVSNKDEAAAGDEVTLTISPSDGYRLVEDTLKVNNGAVDVAGAGNTYTFTMPAEAVTVEAEFEELPDGQYSVTISSGLTNGGIVPDKTSAADGDTVTLTINPSDGYRLKVNSLKVNNGAVDVAGAGPYTFTMPAYHVTVVAEFEAIPYSITISGISNGDVTATYTSGGGQADTATLGTGITLTVTPSANYRLKANSLKVNNSVSGLTSGAENTWTFTMPAATVMVQAEFERIYNISIGSLTNANGSTITRTPEIAGAGDEVILTINPSDGHQLKADTLKINGSTSGLTSGAGNTWVFTMPVADVTVTAEFEAESSGPYTISLGVINHGTVTLDRSTANPGTEYIILIAVPADGYQYAANSITVTKQGGGTVSLSHFDTSASFTMPYDNVTVTAQFRAKDYTINISSLNHGSIEATVNSSPAETATVEDTVTLTATPEDNYELLSITVTKAGGGTVEVNGTGNSRTFAMPASNVTVQAVFGQSGTYAVTIPAAFEHGTVSSSHPSAAPGTEVTLTGTPNSVAYKLTSVTVTRTDGDGTVEVSGAGNIRKFTMPQSHVTVDAEFVYTTYTVTIDTGITNGTVTVAPSSGSTIEGGIVSLTVNPESGYRLKNGSIKVKNGDANVNVNPSNGKWIFTMPGANVTVTVEFELIPTYAITLGPFTNGTVTRTGTDPVAPGTTVTLTVMPDESYQLMADSLKVNSGAVVVTGTGNTYTFIMPESAVTVTATFVEEGEALPAGLYEVTDNIPGAAKTLSGDGTMLAKALTWIKNSGSNSASYLIVLDTDETETTSANGYVIGTGVSSGAAITGSKTGLTITLQGAPQDPKKTVTIEKTTTNGPLFTVYGSSSNDIPHLVLGENITLKGFVNNRPLVILCNGTSSSKIGRLTMLKGSMITGNTNSTTTTTRDGGAVNVGHGEFIMQGGAIAGNSGATGAAVIVYSNGTFTKTGGIIYGSTVEGENTNTPTGTGHVIKTNTQWRDSTAGEDVNTADSNFWEN